MRNFLLVLLFIKAHLVFSQDYQLYTENGKQGLKNASGEILIPAKYDQLGWTKGDQIVQSDVIGFKENGSWGLISVKNKRLTEPTYFEVYSLYDNFFAASRVGKFSGSLLYGVLTSQGKVQVSFRYLNIELLTSQHFLVRESINGIKMTGIISINEEVIVPVKFKSIQFDEQGNIYPELYNSHVGFYTSRGKKILDPAFNEIRILENQYLMVEREGMNGLYDLNGTVVEEASNKSIAMGQSALEVTEFPVWDIINENNETEFQLTADSLKFIGERIYQLYRNGLSFLHEEGDEKLAQLRDKEIIEITEDHIIVEGENKYEVYKKDGSPFVEGFYDSIVFDDEYIYLKHFVRKNPWIVYNKFGSRLSKFSYEKVRLSSDKMIPVFRSGYWGFLNFRGDEVVTCKFDSVRSFQNNQAIVKFHETWGLINTFGDWVILPYEHSLVRIYDSAYLSQKERSIKLYNAFGEITKKITDRIEIKDYGIQVLGDSGALGLMNTEGEMIAMAVYDKIVPLEGSDLLKIFIGGKFGVIRNTGATVVPLDARLQGVVGTSEGFIGVKIDGKYGFVDYKGLLRISNRYDSTELFSEGMVAVKINDGWGFVDRLENLLIQPNYTEVLPFNADVTAVKYENKWGLLHRSGEVKIEVQYDAIDRTDSGNYILTQGEKKGLADKSGKLIIYPKYDEILDLNNDHFLILSNGKSGVIDLSGNYVIPNLYKEIKYDYINHKYLARK